MSKYEKVSGCSVRMCAGCSQRYDKREHGFIKVVNSGGNVFVDETGKASGRGAYVCRNKACIDKVRKSGRLAKVLRTSVPDNVYDRMEELLDR